MTSNSVDFLVVNDLRFLFRIAQLYRSYVCTHCHVLGVYFEGIAVSWLLRRFEDLYYLCDYTLRPAQTV